MIQSRRVDHMIQTNVDHMIHGLKRRMRRQTQTPYRPRRRGTFSKCVTRCKNRGA